jgi:3-hydroxybutyryl-CoA dehydrogenase
MKVVVIGDARSQEAIKARSAEAKVEWIWLKTLEEVDKTTEGDCYMDLDFVFDQQRIDRLALLLPRPVLINAVLPTLREIGQPFIRINGWPGFLKRPVAEVAVSAREQEQKLLSLFDSLQWPFQLVPDIAGMISARIISMIVNEAYFTFEAKTSTKDEIDIAMKLGTNYPKGPFEWSREIGLKNIYDLLMCLAKSDGRYRPSTAMALELKKG